MMRLLLLSAILLVAAAPGPSRQKDAVPEATPDGKPIDCLSQTQIRETRIRSDKVIDFYATGGRVYRNELPMECPGLKREGRFLHKTTTNDYCSTDTITVLYTAPVMQGPTCGLGQFQPVKLAKPVKPAKP